MTDWRTPRSRRRLESAREVAFGWLVPVLVVSAVLVLIFGMLGH